MTSGAEKSRIRRAIDRLAPEGSTNAAAGCTWVTSWRLRTT
jgi:hypothetical protein